MRLKKIIVLLIIIISIIISLAVVLGFMRTPSLEKKDSFSKEVSGKDVKTSKGTSEETSEVKPEVEKVTGLIIGLDKSKGLTDVVMVASFDPNDGKMKFVSIPRDLLINFEDPRFLWIKNESENLHIRYCKLTEIYSNVGDEEEAVKIIEEVAEEIVGFPIDYYAKVDLEGFRAIIDVVDGVEVEVPQDLNYDDWSQDLHIHLKKGLQVLDGDKAEQLVRYRHGYVDGDKGRIRMQQAVIKALGSKVMKMRNPLKIFNLVKEGYQYVDTDFGLMDAMNYIDYISDIKIETIFNQDNMATIPTGGEKIDGLWYEIQDEEKTKEILDELF